MFFFVLLAVVCSNSFLHTQIFGNRCFFKNPLYEYSVSSMDFFPLFLLQHSTRLCWPFTRLTYLFRCFCVLYFYIVAVYAVCHLLWIFFSHCVFDLFVYCVQPQPHKNENATGCPINSITILYLQIYIYNHIINIRPCMSVYIYIYT